MPDHYSDRLWEEHEANMRSRRDRLEREFNVKINTTRGHELDLIEKQLRTDRAMKNVTKN